ncbi:hypothetical protein TESG_07574 [Trichophyton tonsurans CBS 112818]|uniref:Yos1-like protein n=2 Tax=Trichophyton TaxID=5550 RepID=F2PMB1_TRIEC|nr:hypothetical protein TESG_07574 [Trichophyton tonsurans CBS 112818]EGE03008.1 hypothetical protein TEQG_02045 [Trichophyton equinum CBS 127.97]
MFFFGLGKLFQVVILIINAIAILSEDRFLARIGWSRTQYDAGFGATHDSTSIKAKSADLIASVRTVMRIPLIAINMLVIFYEHYTPSWPLEGYRSSAPTSAEEVT